ncbi:MAG: ribonuclease P protein subunit [Candidatus Kariarchaeaceae archaeon]|jgi:RNase P/RNase MRP subunit p29
MNKPKRLGEKRLFLRSILKNWLTGLRVTVIEHTDPNLINIAGNIVQETKSMLTIQTDNGIKKVEKSSGVFFLFDESMKFKIAGKIIDGTPKMRRKRKYRNW